MSAKNVSIHHVDLTDSDDTVQVAARRMYDHKVGTLVVCDDRRRPIGLLTDRDLAVRIVGEAKDPLTTTVEEVMTREPQCVAQDAPIERVLKTMRSGPYRRLPVVDDAGELVGLISLDDVLAHITEEFREIGTLLAREDPSSLAVGSG